MASVDHPFQFDRPFQWQATRRSPSDFPVFVCPNFTSNRNRCATRFPRSNTAPSRRLRVRPTRRHRRLDRIPSRSTSRQSMQAKSRGTDRIQDSQCRRRAEGQIDFKTVNSSGAERRSVRDRARTNGMITATAGRPSAPKALAAALFDLDAIPVPRSAR
jgi:hypothetical protein